MVRIENLTKMFDNEGIRKLSVSFEDNKIHTVIGRSGSGKSLMLRNMLGLIKPDSGRVLYNEVDIHKCTYSRLKELRNSMGVLFQNNALFDSMTVNENIALPLVYDGRMDTDEALQRVNAALLKVGLEGTGER